MALYNFQRRFVEFVKDGTKTHTIRGERKHEPKVGDIAHLYYGLRTKEAKLLLRAPIILIQPIVFERARVWIDGEELDASEKDQFAWRDGYRNAAGRPQGCFDQMLQFWVDTRHTTDFAGNMIHWDYSKRFLDK